MAEKTMNKKLILSALIILLPFSVMLGWGAEGHKLISNKAMTLIPDEMSSFTKWQDYVTTHSVEPDLRRDSDKSEGPKHFIDIDFYPEFLNGKMIEDKARLVAEYGDSTVTKMGLLPWATLDTYNKLVTALKEKNRDKALIYLSDLGHYVADGHQPMHAIMNYNGQMSGQKGIHFRYESVMVDSNLSTIKDDFHAEKAVYISTPLDFIFKYITDANSVSDVLFDADTFAYKKTNSREDAEYYRLLWFKTRYITETQIENAASDFASLFYSAWLDAGKPSFDEIN
jgi:hypothetical protein